MSSSFRSFAVKLFAVCALFMLVGAGVYAQSTVYGAISGAVADPHIVSSMPPGGGLPPDAATGVRANAPANACCTICFNSSTRKGFAR